MISPFRTYNTMTISALSKRKAAAIEKLNEIYRRLAEAKGAEANPLQLPQKFDQETRAMLTLEYLAERFGDLLPSEPASEPVPAAETSVVTPPVVIVEEESEAEVEAPVSKPRKK